MENALALYVSVLGVGILVAADMWPMVVFLAECLHFDRLGISVPRVEAITLA